MLDDAAPFDDYSSYGRTGVMVAGTVTTAVSLVAGAAYSSVFSNSNSAKFDSPIYIQGYESQPFSLEVSFRIIDEGSPVAQKVLSTVSNYDGITVVGTVVSFSTKYATAAEAKISYDVIQKQNVHVVGVHTYDKNQLFVNGQLVGELDLTDAQKADTYVTTDGKLYLGTSTGTGKIAANGISVYGHALTESAVQEHFNAARKTILASGVAVPLGGKRYPLSAELGDVYLNKSFTTEADWKTGVQNQTVIEDDILKPQILNGTSVASNWQSVAHLDNGITSIYGVSMTWTGSGATIEVSLDGTTWVTPVQGERISIITAGYNPTNQDLWIKVSFAGSISNDPSYLSELNILGFKTGTSVEIDGRTTTFTSPASLMSEAEPIEQRDDWGVRLSGGTITISTDTTAVPENKYTMNIWLKKLTSTTPTISVSGTTYKNGAAGGTLNQGEWAMYTIVAAAAISSAITITGSAQIGSVELFNTQLSAGSVATLYSSSVGIPIVSSPDTDAIQITNPNPSTKLYAYDWSVTGAGG